MSLKCRFCAAPLQRTFVDLGESPLANSYLTEEQLAQPEKKLPLHVLLCDQCFLVQLPEIESPEAIFSDYAYFSSYSETWLEHCRAFAADAAQRWRLGPQSRVIEVASNDGYLLQYFQQQGVPVLGIEPAANVAQVAAERKIPTRVEFFGSKLGQGLAEEGLRADLLIGNNVFAHTPHLNDFTRGLATVLKPEGVLSLEFPHLLRLMQENQFDTIYHEHFSYFSLTTATRVLAEQGLRVFAVEELPTHGGSLRVLACLDGASHANDISVERLLRVEEEQGLKTLDPYRTFSTKVEETRRQLLDFVQNTRQAGKTVVGYGAPAKGNTLLNYCGLGVEEIAYTVDRSPHKQELFLPGSRLPIHKPQHILLTKPDYILILPWNLRQEIMQQMEEVRHWGGQFVVAIPEVRVLP